MKSNKDEIQKKLGERIRKAREDAKLTQLEVAAKAEMDVNYYARIERGIANPSYEKLHSIMTALNMDSLDIK
ncbi:MAG: helix-turn-helix domain-containing protein [Patescibacteria group bacterium]|nr:helix-turn-helix domain-containing protein [Patescibacteria group bacterium]